MIIHSWDFKGILRHFTAVEFPVVSLRRSTCCPCHWGWKSAHTGELQPVPTQGAQLLHSWSEPGTATVTSASINWLKNAIFCVCAEMGRGLSIAEVWKRRLSGLSVWDYILFSNVKKNKSPKKLKNWSLLNLFTETQPVPGPHLVTHLVCAGCFMVFLKEL